MARRSMKFRRESRVIVPAGEGLAVVGTVLSDAIDGSVVVEAEDTKELITVAPKDRKQIKEA